MNKIVDLGSFEGYKFGVKGQLSHTIHQLHNNYGSQKWENVQGIEIILHLFELVTSLKVNFHKSRLVGIRISQLWLEEAIMLST